MMEALVKAWISGPSNADPTALAAALRGRRLSTLLPEYGTECWDDEPRRDVTYKVYTTQAQRQ